jgi:hypothetical protein
MDSAVFTLQHVADADSVDWDALYPRAVATSCDWVLERSAERVAACDELLALTPANCPSLGIVAMFTQLAPVADGDASALARETGALLRLLDRALAAHGCDHGYAVQAWREHARAAAWVSASLLRPLEPDTYPLMLAARRAAERTGPRRPRGHATGSRYPSGWPTRSGRCSRSTPPPATRRRDRRPLRAPPRTRPHSLRAPAPGF